MKTSDNLDVPTSRGWHIVVGKQTERNCLPKKERRHFSCFGISSLCNNWQNPFFFKFHVVIIFPLLFSILSTVAFVFVLLFVIYKIYFKLCVFANSLFLWNTKVKLQLRWTRRKTQTLFASSQTEVNVSDERAENELSHCPDVFDSTWSKLDLFVIFIDLFFSTSKFRTLCPFRLKLKGFEYKTQSWK